VDFFMAEMIDTAYVLAGGQSRRMGTDKLSLAFDGVSLLERTVSRCAASFDQVKLVAPQVGTLADWGRTVVLDSPEASGPMAGVIAALEDCCAEACFVTAADLFDLRTDVIELLISRYQGEQYLGIGEPEGIQPLCGIYNKSALPVFRARASEGRFGMKDALEYMAADSVALPPGRWRNLNCPDDLATLEGYNG
jgi:molybdopterin-guanine dinucleotide biosynthesis protein A